MSVSRDDDNPFAPPKAAVLAADPGSGEYIPDGQKVATARGRQWFSEAWDLFKAAPGTWVAIYLIFVLVWVVLAIIPMGSLVTSLCYPAVAAGVMLGCRALTDGEPLRVGHLFEGFRKNTGSLLLVGVLYLAASVVIWIVAFVVGAITVPLMMGGLQVNPADWDSMVVLLPAILVVVLIVVTLTLPLLMAMWFAPALVVFHDVAPMAAMRSSFQGCMRNMMPFLLYGLVGLLLAIIAIIPLGLGLLVYGPLLWCTMYLGYRDIFVRTP